MRISTNRQPPLDERGETSDRDRLKSQVSAIATLQVANENITASGSHLASTELWSALAAYTEDQIRLGADTHRLREELRAL